MIANVASFLTGSTHDAGLKGIGGHFDRRNLLFFGVDDVPGQLRFTRTDSGAAITVFARPDRVPADPRMVPLLQRCVAGAATAEEVTHFPTLWQGRDKTLLVDHAVDPHVIAVQP